MRLSAKERLCLMCSQRSITDKPSEHLPVELKFVPMLKDMADLVADKMIELTGDPCRPKRAQAHRYTIERFTGTEWTAA